LRRLCSTLICGVSKFNFTLRLRIVLRMIRHVK
jgi:hypothetical protein